MEDPISFLSICEQGEQTGCIKRLLESELFVQNLGARSSNFDGGSSGSSPTLLLHGNN